jgi:hypothetical protein
MMGSSKPYITPALPTGQLLYLNFLAKQSTKMCNAIYQNHLALDYLLVSEGGVCGKFNLSNSCLQTDDKGKVIKKSQTE